MIECRSTDVGYLMGGIPVIVATDSAGSQIIVGGRENQIHYLSYPYPNHESAVKSAESIVSRGRVDVNSGWENLKEDSGFPGFAMLMFCVLARRGK